MTLKFILAATAVAGLAAGAATAQDAIGQEEYMISCAACHGESGKGDGPIAGLLEIDTPSLTQIAQRHGGEYPLEYVVWAIDGRNLIRAHGAEMPTWGDRYRIDAERTEASAETPEAVELVVRGRALSLAYYLESIQE